MCKNPSLALPHALPLALSRFARASWTSAMIDFAAARRMMVDGQVRTNDVTDLRLIAAMLAVPRERFVPAGKAELAYLDLDLPITDGAAMAGAVGTPGGGKERRLLKPMVLAKLIQTAGVGEGDRVLDVGCAPGYSAAVLAMLAGAVVALEEDAALARLARDNLMAVGARHVEVMTGRLTDGWPAGAPYDVILLDGASEIPPEALFAQLKDGGRLVGVIG